MSVGNGRLKRNNATTKSRGLRTKFIKKKTLIEEQEHNAGRSIQPWKRFGKNRPNKLKW